MRRVGLVLGLFASWSHCTYAQTTQPPDKSQYTLFDPTPDDQLRQFSPDRPGRSHSALTVDAGHFQVESDIWNYSFDRYSNTGQTTRQSVFGTPNIKLGLTNWAELDIVTSLYNDSEMRDRHGGGTMKAYGIGDVFVGGKINIFGNDGGDQSLGALGLIKIPSAAPGLGNNMAEFFLNVPFTTALPKKFSLTIEPSLNLIRNLDKQGYQGDYQFILNLSRPIIDDVVTASIGLALEYSADHNTGPRHTIGPALQWLVRPDVQLDAGVYIGITKAAPDYNPYFGIAFRY